jgi:hypothetical protein
MNVDHDLRLVKAALLYADRAKLCSMKASILLSFIKAGAAKKSERIALLRSMADLTKKAGGLDSQGLLTLLDAYEGMLRIKHRTTPQILAQQRIERAFDRAWGPMASALAEIAHGANIGGLADAVQSGLLDFYAFDSLEGAMDQYLQQITAVMGNVLTYPMFDDQLAQLVNLGTREGKFAVASGAAARAKHIGLAANVLRRLPVFETATISEILNIRSELERPLVRFRGAMAKFSKEIETAAWDATFADDAEGLFVREIEPAVLEIEDAVKANSFLRELATSATSGDAKIVGSAALGLIIAKYGALPDLVGQALGVAVPVGVAGWSAFRAHADRQRDIESNQLFFYYKARQLLSHD